MGFYSPFSEEAALVTLGLLLAVSAAQAQEARVKADVPFDFVVGNQVLPAGEYMVVPEGDALQAILIRSNDNKASALSIVSSCANSRTADTTKLVFHRVGGRYFLSQIWAQGYAQGRQLPMSKTEVQLAKNNTTEEFVLAANLM
jgi:hypothetical protein